MKRQSNALDEQDVLFYTRCQKVAGKAVRRKGLPGEVAEDFPAWALARRKAGAKGTLDQLLIDYLRGAFGIAHTEAQAMRKALRTASCNQKALDTIGAGGEPTPEEALAHAQLFDLAAGPDRAMLMLSFKFGFSHKEIAELFGLSEARISQRLKGALSELRSKLAAG